jgi:hypothetical protein
MAAGASSTRQLIGEHAVRIGGASVYAERLFVIAPSEQDGPRIAAERGEEAVPPPARLASPVGVLPAKRVAQPVLCPFGSRGIASSMRSST